MQTATGIGCALIFWRVVPLPWDPEDMPQRIQLLLVEDNADDAELAVRELRRAQFDPHWHRVETELDYLVKLRADIDVIISDIKMPQFSWQRALELMKERGYEIPFIILSGTIGEEVAVQAIKQGATDYLLKDRIGRLGSAVQNAVEQFRLRRGCKKAEEAALEGERKFRALFDSAHDSIYMLHHGVFVDCNAKGQFMYGRTWDEIVGHTPDEFAPLNQPDGRNSREKAGEIVMKALAGESQVFEWMVYHKDGSPVFSDISLNRLELGGEVYLMAIARDVTEKKQAEVRMAEQAALLDKARDAITVRELNGKILFWNKGAEQMYGWRSEEVLGKRIAQLIYPSMDKFEEANRLLMENGEWSGEVLHLTKDKRELTVEARWTLVRDKGGKPQSVLAINTDITDKKAIEAQLRRAQRIESIGTLAGGIAHDLNNILAPIMTSIEVLKMTTSDPHATRMLDTIDVSAKRGAGIVRQVLSFARGLEGEKIEVQPRHLLKEIETIIKDTFPKNIRLELFFPKETWTIQGDPNQLQQILLNLCVNARDAMPNGGRLAVILENRVIDEEYAAKQIQARPGKYVTITVSDSGTGVPDALIDKIFEPFFTTKELGKGTGLGLSTVLAIAKSHHGFIEVQSDFGKGSAFTVYLPAMEVLTRKRDDTEIAAVPHGSGETVLVVDDEPSILEVTCDTLNAFGYRTLTARNGVEALDVYNKSQESISVVLTDMNMPIMDGRATIRALLKLNPSLKIIPSSGLQTSDGADAASDARSKYFLTKPYSTETLLRTVRAILDAP